MTAQTIQNREEAVLEMLEKIPKEDVVLIGGYAVNAYVPPRFSIDCDLVVVGSPDKIEKALEQNGFVRAEEGDVTYGNYVRYMREMDGVSFDLLVNSVLDRETGISFEGKMFEEHSREMITIGRASPVRIKMRIADPEMLFVMKFVAARRQDIRDIFMLAGWELDWDAVGEMISVKCKSELIVERVDLIRRSVKSEGYRHSLQGPYGKMPDEMFDRCEKRLVQFLEKLELVERKSLGQH